MGTSTDNSNNLISGTVQTISMMGYYIQSNAGSIRLSNALRTSSNSISSYFSFDSLNSYPQMILEEEER